MKTFIFRSFGGICFGALVMVVICFGIIVFGEVGQLNSGIFMKNAIGTLLCGWFFSVATLIFEVERWSLLFQTFIHFVTVSILYFILSFSIGWIPYSTTGIILGIGVFLVIYAIIWTIFYLYFRHQTKLLNELIE